VYNISRKAGKPESRKAGKPESRKAGKPEKVKGFAIEFVFIYAFHSNVFHFQDSNTITDMKKLFNGFLHKKPVKT
jgi:hypothetical protein